jgi:hypothetical protein
MPYTMPLGAPISHHLDFYRYWLAKRDGPGMPARSDLNPCDIPKLLPYLTIVDKIDGQFHYRLAGTAVSQELGRDLTGSFVGSYVTPPEYAAALRAIYERVFTGARPIFTTGEYKAKSGAIHSVSRLMLPLSDDGTNVNMVIFTRIACFSWDTAAEIDWLMGAPGKVCDVVYVNDAADLEKRCLDWERHCFERMRNTIATA